MIPQCFDPRQIASLRITEHLLVSERYFSALQTFDQLISLTVMTERLSNKISSLLAQLPNLQRLALWHQHFMHHFIGYQLQTYALSFSH